MIIKIITIPYVPISREDIAYKLKQPKVSVRGEDIVKARKEAGIETQKEFIALCQQELDKGGYPVTEWNHQSRYEQPGRRIIRTWRVAVMDLVLNKYRRQ